MEILHISAECYPAAKSGGLGDVVGALPKYLNKIGKKTAVIIPKYGVKWLNEQSYTDVWRGAIRMSTFYVNYTILFCENKSLGFDLYVVDIPGFFDRNGVYADNNTGKPFHDEVERSILFQQAVLQWIIQMKQKPKVLHCHDHHTGLIPFMVKHCPEYNSLSSIPTVFTIHNGQYHGSFRWANAQLLPFFDANAGGLLDWQDVINPLATGVKCSWRFTTVSPGYLEEIQYKANGLEHLIQFERNKGVGILNGIDSILWDPKKDELLAYHLKKNIEEFKVANKKELTTRFNFETELPLFVFIGRLVGEKGADLLPDSISRFLHSGQKASFLVLGTGEPHLKEALWNMKHQYYHYFDTSLEYNETLAHQMYAGADFLIMPSKVEPCGLNQMYALRYGTIPVVRSVGGLKDTILDIGIENGFGFCFDDYSVDALHIAYHRANELYYDKVFLDKIRKRIMAIDHSWDQTAQQYIDIYNSFFN